jgi:transcriptional regulator with XRE-family HTH domain
MNRLGEIRKSLHMTQEQFIRHVGIHVSIQRYSNYENDESEPNFTTKRVIALRLGVSLSYLWPDYGYPLEPENASCEVINPDYYGSH